VALLCVKHAYQFLEDGHDGVQVTGDNLCERQVEDRRSDDTVMGLSVSTFPAPLAPFNLLRPLLPVLLLVERPLLFGEVVNLADTYNVNDIS